ncbi:hypothetical protein PoMZ_08797 [Pyricularia oryzae]|uniref:Uncharacterized protein n=1 Tax=Pyricularia oryzae TaxID=318829 RepID=A0A4P7NIK5_PYROR|nr:hypothetical protein PoMZ_08797 [Pyricularia oryzae]
MPGDRVWIVKSGIQYMFEHNGKEYSVMAYDKCNLVWPAWGKKGGPEGLTFEYEERWPKNKDGEC